MLNLPDLTRNFLLTTALLLLAGTFCFAQNKFDLEIKVEPATDTVRGGETLSYTVTVVKSRS